MAKIIKYNFLSCRINHGTEESPDYEDVILPKEIRCSSANLEANVAIAKKEAYNGEYSVEDVGSEETTTPTRLDVIEAQVTYTAMMTDTLLEV